jgi:hypothetical protein
MSDVTIETRKCMQCGKVSFIEVTYEEYQRWQRGEHAQAVWPQWTAEQRELLISGTHPECWDELMGPEEDEDDEPPGHGYWGIGDY